MKQFLEHLSKELAKNVDSLPVLCPVEFKKLLNNAMEKITSFDVYGLWVYDNGDDNPAILWSLHITDDLAKKAGSISGKRYFTCKLPIRNY